MIILPIERNTEPKIMDPASCILTFRFLEF